MSVEILAHPKRREGAGLLRGLLGRLCRGPSRLCGRSRGLRAVGGAALLGHSIVVLCGPAHVQRARGQPLPDEEGRSHAGQLLQAHAAAGAGPEEEARPAPERRAGGVHRKPQRRAQVAARHALSGKEAVASSPCVASSFGPACASSGLWRAGGFCRLTVHEPALPGFSLPRNPREPRFTDRNRKRWHDGELSAEQARRVQHTAARAAGDASGAMAPTWAVRLLLVGVFTFQVGGNPLTVQTNCRSVVGANPVPAPSTVSGQITLCVWKEPPFILPASSQWNRPVSVNAEIAALPPSGAVVLPDDPSITGFDVDFSCVAPFANGQEPQQRMKLNKFWRGHVCRRLLFEGAGTLLNWNVSFLVANTELGASRVARAQSAVKGADGRHFLPSSPRAVLTPNAPADNAHHRLPTGMYANLRAKRCNAAITGITLCVLKNRKISTPQRNRHASAAKALMSPALRRRDPAKDVCPTNGCGTPNGTSSEWE